jgi:hypothetical protein
MGNVHSSAASASENNYYLDDAETRGTKTTEFGKNNIRKRTVKIRSKALEKGHEDAPVVAQGEQPEARALVLPLIALNLRTDRVVVVPLAGRRRVKQRFECFVARDPSRCRPQCVRYDQSTHTRNSVDLHERAMRSKACPSRSIATVPKVRSVSNRETAWAEIPRTDGRFCGSLCGLLDILLGCESANL